MSEELGYLSYAKVFRVLAIIHDLPELELRTALSLDSSLVRCGLVSVDRVGNSPLRGTA